MFRKILVANDGSAGAQKALRVASDLAKQCEAELHSITVEEDQPPHGARVLGGELRSDRKARDYYHLLTIEAGQTAAASGVRLTSHVLPGHETATIITFAQEHRFDLLVIGFLGHSKIFGQHWGSTSQNLVQLSPCTVLIVK
jgi:nucleotide-binding universal stress UspA family protein